MFEKIMSMISTCAFLLHFDAPNYIKIELKKNWYGARRKDKNVYNLLQDVQHGFFVESGAFDGITGSNTLAFEKKGWDGLLVEPSIQNFRKLISHRRKSYHFNGFLDAKNTEFKLPETASGQGVHAHMTSNSMKSYVVPAKPLSELLKCLNVTTIDFWSIDIEGYEESVLETFNFKQFEVGVMLIEVDKKQATTDNIFKIMKRNKFEFWGGLSSDALFVNPKYFKERNLIMRKLDEMTSTQLLKKYHVKT